jgi:hypothetical protein
MTRKQLLGAKMKAKQLILVGTGLVFFLTLLPNTASARVNFHIGFGTGIGHSYRHSHFGLHGGYHRWPSRRYKVFGHRHFSHHKPRHSSGVNFWIGGLFPIVIRPPIIVKTPKVITQRRVVVEELECQSKLDDNNTTELFEKLRRRKSELLKKLRIGDKDKRKETIRELAGFSFDNKVREALEDVLLSDPDPELRKQVAKSFGKTSNKKVLPALKKAEADDPNREVREEAYKAIITIRGYKL